jgi:uncharacterized protein (TIGR02284 family)
MVTLVGTQTETLDALKDLVELDFDAIEAYKEAIERLENESYKDKFRSFQKDHERHIVEISKIIKDEGEVAPNGPSNKQYLTKGKIIIASLVNDKAILLAMKTNEDDTNTAYERLTKYDLSEIEMQIITRGLQDERNHRKWIEDTLTTL